MIRLEWSGLCFTSYGQMDSDIFPPRGRRSNLCFKYSNADNGFTAKFPAELAAAAAKLGA